MIKNFLLFNLKRLGLKIPAEAATGTHTKGHLYHTRQLAKSCYSLTPREKPNVLQNTTAETFLLPTYGLSTDSPTISSFLYLSCFPDTSLRLKERKYLIVVPSRSVKPSERLTLMILHAISA